MLFVFSFLKLWFNWRLIALQYCVGLCHTSTWISHRHTCIPSLLNPSPTPSHPSRLSRHTGLSSLLTQQIPTGYLFHGLPSGSAGKESSCNVGNLGLIPGLKRSPGEGNGYALQYSSLKDSMDRGAWQSMVHRVAKSQTRLSNYTYLPKDPTNVHPSLDPGKEVLCNTRSTTYLTWYLIWNIDVRCSRTY